jgi:hypothetical protein
MIVDQPSRKLVMAEVPSTAFRTPEYAALGIDGVSIGAAQRRILPDAARDHVG